ncbi:MAG TPA: peptidase inhibitor family I36 protein [Cellulomonas sp.]
MTGRRRGSFAATLALVLVGLAASPVAAVEAGPESSSQCLASQFCLWSGAGFSSLETSTTSTTAAGVSFSRTLSVWNRSSYAARVYSGSGGTGTSVCFEPGAQVSSTSVSSASFALLTATSC